METIEDFGKYDELTKLNNLVRDLDVLYTNTEFKNPNEFLRIRLYFHKLIENLERNL